MRIAAPIEIGPLDADAQQAVRDLAKAAEAHDGVAPLSEQPRLNLGTDAEWITHVVAHTKAGSTIGYVQIDRSGETASAELVIHPEHRRNGHGRMLLKTAERDATLPSRSGEPGQHGKSLRVWAHGDLESARGFARAAGLRAVRELLFLARPTTPAETPSGAPTATPELPEAPAGYRLRTFRPGVDDDAWLRVNARAFATHPEQGRMTLDDLRARQAEEWFDPEGFFLLVPEGTPEDAAEGTADADPVAFQWTKVEPGQPDGGRDGARDGEIYVLGVDPDHQGKGLGRLMTDVGLAHLARTGATRAVLYVEGDNAPALATYERSGFTRAAVHVQYARP